MQRSRHVACLSMPDNLHELARDLSDLERRLAAGPAEPERRCRRRRSRSVGRLPVADDGRWEGSADGDRGWTGEDDDGYYLGALDDGSVGHGRQDLGSRSPTASSTWAEVFDGASDMDVLDEESDAVGLSLSEPPERSDPSGLVEPRHPKSLDRTDSPTSGSQAFEDQSTMASACLRELLSVLGVDENLDSGSSLEFHDPKAVDSKSPCSVLSYHPNSMPLAKERNSADDVSGDRFAMLSPERRANSMPMPQPQRMGVPPPPRGTMPRKSSMRNLSSALGASSGSLKRTVSFHKLQIREYNVELSDHPSCSCGPPIQLGWDYRDRATVPLEEYEERRLPRRRCEDLVLSYNARRYLLLKRAGYSKQELRRVVEEVNKVKRERLLTDFFSPMMKFDETMEEIMDQVKATFSIKKKRELRGQLIL